MTASKSLKSVLARQALALCLGLTLCGATMAQSAATDTQASATAQGFVDAEVKKIGMPPGKVVLKHGPIPNLDMPAMTMTFAVANPQWLETFEPGDKVQFKADKVNATFTVTELQKAP